MTNLLVVGYQDGILIFFDHPQSDLGSLLDMALEMAEIEFR